MPFPVDDEEGLALRPERAPQPFAQQLDERPTCDLAQHQPQDVGVAGVVAQLRARRPLARERGSEVVQRSALRQHPAVPPSLGFRIAVVLAPSDARRHRDHVEEAYPVVAGAGEPRREIAYDRLQTGNETYVDGDADERSYEGLS